MNDQSIVLALDQIRIRQTSELVQLVGHRSWRVPSSDLPLAHTYWVTLEASQYSFLCQIRGNDSFLWIDR